MMTLPDLLALILEKKKLLDTKRLPRAVRDALMREEDVTITCNSTGLEGNSYNMHETKYLLEKGLTVDGKPINDAFEIYDHAEAMRFVRSLGETKINKAIMLDVHRNVLYRSKPEAAGVYRKEGIFVTGTSFVFPSPEELPAKMAGFYEWLGGNHAEEHPLTLAVDAHLRFVTVHPFADGNGRSARLLMNMLLMQSGFPPCCPPREIRAAYMEAVRGAQLGGPLEPLLRLFANCELEALDRYLDAVNNNNPR